jgi:hypothetical protein
MSSAFLPPPAQQALFDLVRRNAGFKVERKARDFIRAEIDHREETVGLVV